ILITDPKAIQHVLVSHSYDYIKPPNIQNALRKILGNGVLIAEGVTHKKQRKMINPAFSYKHVKEMVASMIDPAKQLRQMWISAIENGEREVDVLSAMSRATLDIIGRAGNYIVLLSAIPPRNFRSVKKCFFSDFSQDLVTISILS